MEFSAHVFEARELLGEKMDPATTLKRAAGFFTRAKQRGDAEAQKYWGAVLQRAKSGAQAAAGAAGAAKAAVVAGAGKAASAAGKAVAGAIKGDPHTYGGHGSDAHEPASKGSFWDRLKGAAKSLKDAPANVKKLITDKEYRGEVGKSVGSALKRKAKGAWGVVKHEAEEFKTAGKALKKIAKKEPLTDHDKKAMKSAAKAIAFTVVGTVAMGGLGHLTLGALGKHFAAETALKAVGRAALFAGADDASEMDAMMAKWAEAVTEMVAERFEGLADMTPEQIAEILAAADDDDDEDESDDASEGRTRFESVVRLYSMKPLGEAEAQKATPTSLPDDPYRYFVKTPDSELVDVSKLQTIRARPEGIANAAKHMANAYNGDGAKRKPISLRKLDSGKYEVCDGNSTTAMAKQHGWKKIVAIVSDECETHESVNEAIDSATVATFLMVLRSKLTQYDKRLGDNEAKKGRTNIYRLGHYLKAAEDVEKAVSGSLQKDDPESLKALKAALSKSFVPDLPPVKATLKQIDAYLDSGKKPTLK